MIKGLLIWIWTIFMDFTSGIGDPIDFALDAMGCAFVAYGIWTLLIGCLSIVYFFWMLSKLGYTK